MLMQYWTMNFQSSFLHDFGAMVWPQEERYRSFPFPHFTPLHSTPLQTPPHSVQTAPGLGPYLLVPGYFPIPSILSNSCIKATPGRSRLSVSLSFLHLFFLFSHARLHTPPTSHIRTQRMATEDTITPSPPDTSNNDTGLDPGRTEKEHPPGAPIPGQACLDEAVGKAVGGTIIPSDIQPSDMPTPPQPTADATKPVPETPHPSTIHRNSEVTPSEKQKTSVKDKLEKLKSKTVGAYPIKTQIGWLEAHQRTDGPQNEYRDKAIWMEEFASSALFGAFWQNAAAVIVIPVVCFVVFKLGGGVVSMILIIAFGGEKDKESRFLGFSIFFLHVHAF